MTTPTKPVSMTPKHPTPWCKRPFGDDVCIIDATGAVVMWRSVEDGEVLDLIITAVNAHEALAEALASAHRWVHANCSVLDAGEHFVDCKAAATALALARGEVKP